MDFVDAAKGYLDALQSPTDRNAYELTKATAQLIMAYHADDGPVGAPDCDEPDIDPVWARKITENVRNNFPYLGFYPVASLEAVNGQHEISYGDAADDAIDVGIDLQRFLIMVENGFRESARWFFRFGFHSHWGNHAHDLLIYLHKSKISD